MNERMDRRAELGLSQATAAASAGLSLATWRRWEESPDSVSAKTRQACEGVLAEESELSRALTKSAVSFEESWGEDPSVTPRQAYALALTLDMWADGELESWVRNPQGPLHEVGPFVQFDRRVMFYLDGNRAWVEATRERCYAISDEIERGVLPFDRPGAYIDELLVAAALPEAQAYLADMPEIFDRILPRGADRNSDSEERYWVDDQDWDGVSDGFDDRCQWDEWEVPVMKDHPLLPAVLAERHPFTWFDVVSASGPGYLQRLQGSLMDDGE